MRGVARKTRWLVLVVGIAAAIGVAIITGIQGCGNTDKYGRVPVPGETAVDLDEGKYTLYYQEHVNLSSDDSLDAPDGIRITARGLAGAPAPEIDLGGIPSSISVNDEHSVSIGKLKIKETGRYGLTAGRSPRPADRPAITVGETFGTTAKRGGKDTGLVIAATVFLFVLLGLIAPKKPAKPVPIPTAPYSGFPPEPSPPPKPVPVPREIDADAQLTALERLADLYEGGSISREELDRLKREVLS